MATRHDAYARVKELTQILGKVRIVAMLNAGTDLGGVTVKDVDKMVSELAAANAKYACGSNR